MGSTENMHGKCGCRRWSSCVGARLHYFEARCALDGGSGCCQDMPAFVLFLGCLLASVPKWDRQHCRYCALDFIAKIVRAAPVFPSRPYG